ncbi:MAG: prepilin-type N-terminal cleavage/methylation domain-containing protein [Desulfobacterales bacterium]|nr:prepilin-type N-terminal cleavage/methylation domain-containing protein [Desulfobacterales bacterium]
MKKNQSGFTLVEIAIVMVIIGLLIGGVLKGQEMIKNAKTKRIMSDADGLRAAVASYQDRYVQLPGDDTQNPAHGCTGCTAGNGNGQIELAEAPDVFQHLRLAGIISGAGLTLPKNSYGGTYQVYWQALGAGANLINAHWLEYTNIPAEVAQSIDITNDDGAQATGSVRGSAAYTAGTVITLYVQF